MTFSKCQIGNPHKQLLFVQYDWSKPVSSQVMANQPWSEEDKNLETLKKELSEADQTLHETLNKMNKIKEERKLKVEEIWQVHDTSTKVSQIQRKIVKLEKKK